jgi:hypothetical protein
MAEFLTTTGVSHHIENIIKTAKKNLYLISPFLKLTKNFYERLKDASDRGVMIDIYYGKNELDYSERQKLTQLRNIQVYYSENLHAKCFYNEDTMVITSMNMYEFSEKNNREMGILINKLTDPKIFQDAVDESRSIKSSAVQEAGNNYFNGFNTYYNNDQSQQGFCIRCQMKIEFNTGKPLCKSCFHEWNLWANETYSEEFCHGCGTQFKVSFSKPLCQRCFLKYTF